MKIRVVGAVLAGAAILFTGLTVTAAPAAADGSCALLVACAPDPPAAPPVGTEKQEPEPPPADTKPEPSPARPAVRSSAEVTADLLVLMNRERADHGLPLFTRRGDVDAVAAGWSDQLAADGRLSHNDAYFTPESRKRLGGKALGENVARDAEAQPAHANLMASPHHRDNVLDARFTVVGLGATYRDGSWWITQDFLQPATGGGREVTRSAGPPAPASPRPGRPEPATAAAPAAEVADVATVDLDAIDTWRVTAPGFHDAETAADPMSSGTAPVETNRRAIALSVALAFLACVGGIDLRRRRVAGLATS